VSEAKILLPSLKAPSPVTNRAAILIPPGTRRRLIVAAALVGSDLGSGLVAKHTAGVLIQDSFTLDAWTLPTLILVYWALGLYEGFGPCPFERLRLRAQGIMLLVVIDCASGFMAGGPLRLRFLAFAGVSLLLIGYYVEILARSALIQRGLWGGAVVFVGAGVRIGQLAKYLEKHPEFGLRPAGFVSTTQSGAAHMPSFLPELGRAAELEIVAPWAELLILASGADESVASPSIQRRQSARRLVMVGEPQDLPSLWLRTRSLGRLIGVELPQPPQRWKQHFKRVVDLLAAVPACLLAAPTIGLAAMAIKMVDPGPAFYFQDRIGINGRNVRVCKLRTMFQDAEDRLQEHLARDPQAAMEWQRFFKLRHDPRTLPVVGPFLRRTSLDELPQLYNVLLGQMSLIGPRPFPAYHVRSFDREFQAIRCSVPPGLSGLWQVAARSNGDLDVQREQDLFYILNWSIWLDLYILIETPVAIFAARGAR
jgi:lipopolysaccharide/colanic/teichoic acid biosynthesis glycosyltransferase